jgi:hypothetical protein
VLLFLTAPRTQAGHIRATERVDPCSVFDSVESHVISLALKAYRPVADVSLRDVAILAGHTTKESLQAQCFRRFARDDFHVGVPWRMPRPQAARRT